MGIFRGIKTINAEGIVDDIAVLAETDIKNKGNIAKRKSLYSQLQGQVQQLSEAIKDKEGTIETLERQLVQAGIKQKVMQADVEINKKKEEVKSQLGKEFIETEGKQKLCKTLMESLKAVPCGHLTEVLLGKLRADPRTAY